MQSTQWCCGRHHCHLEPAHQCRKHRRNPWDGLWTQEDQHQRRVRQWLRQVHRGYRIAESVNMIGVHSIVGNLLEAE